MYSQLISNFVDQESLPSSYIEDAGKFVVPLVDQIAQRILGSADTLFIGLNGAQGTGKTTLAKLLVKLLEARGFGIANLSIDDFYFTKAERQLLAEKQHPLLITRGVPGTHDTSLLLKKITEFRNLESKQVCEVPRFNKAMDDRCGLSDWQRVTGPIDSVLLEGWFVGAPPQEAEDLGRTVNVLEESEDKDGSWREFVNTQLAGQYQAVFDQLDLLIMLKAPSFEQVFEWRALQEEKLRNLSSLHASAIMDEDQLERFIQHYERITRHCLEYLPEKADYLYELGSDHRIFKATATSD
ncbi:MAG: hypothetical protein GKR91_18665 [Pseudomonadales bacterium]|nr:hypothetical protein [Pseudomonadales bacterium]